ncbi:unnamed protein product, partial [Vitis vinifera]|uniref:Uncharacterized protein n=1 Tax=Vitis vinifera TaxID=29760 RepID=D7T7X1_VITVI
MEYKVYKGHPFLLKVWLQSFYTSYLGWCLAALSACD